MDPQGRRLPTISRLWTPGARHPSPGLDPGVVQRRGHGHSTVWGHRRPTTVVQTFQSARDSLDAAIIPADTPVSRAARSEAGKADQQRVAVPKITLPIRGLGGGDLGAGRFRLAHDRAVQCWHSRSLYVVVAERALPSFHCNPSCRQTLSD
jgi:hypothetical protein